MQPFTAPIHLLGLGAYNRVAPVGAASRLAAAFHDYGSVVGARMVRQLPAFGIGDVGNRALRTTMRRKVCEWRGATHLFEERPPPAA